MNEPIVTGNAGLPTPKGMVTDGGAVDLCWAYSRHYRDELGRYDLRPTLVLLAHQLCLESFDRFLLVGKLDDACFKRWARHFGWEDSKGLRPDWARKYLADLHDLQIVDWNRIQETFELRPDSSVWNKVLLSLRQKGPDDKQEKLPLRAERPLSEATSDLSRESAQASVATPSVPASSHQAERGSAGRTTPLGASFFSEARRIVNGEITHEEFCRWADEAFPHWRTMPLVGNSGPGTGGKLADVPGNGRDNSTKPSSGFPDERRENSTTVSSGNPDDQPKPVKMGATARSDPSSGNPDETPSIASLAFSTKTRLARGSSGNPDDETIMAKSPRIRGAWKWLLSVDTKGDLNEEMWPDSWVRREWWELCVRDPDYVLRKMRGCFEDNQRRVAAAENGVDRVTHPLAWLAFIAREAGMLPRRRKTG